jgi:hypothetical protein
MEIQRFRKGILKLHSKRGGLMPNDINRPKRPQKQLQFSQKSRDYSLHPPPAIPALTKMGLPTPYLPISTIINFGTTSLNYKLARCQAIQTSQQKKLLRSSCLVAGGGFFCFALLRMQRQENNGAGTTSSLNFQTPIQPKKKTIKPASLLGLRNLAAQLVLLCGNAGSLRSPAEARIHKPLTGQKWLLEKQSSAEALNTSTRNILFCCQT